MKKSLGEEILMALVISCIMYFVLTTYVPPKYFTRSKTSEDSTKDSKDSKEIKKIPSGTKRTIFLGCFALGLYISMYVL